MEVYCQDEKFTLYQGSMLDMDKVIEPNSIDSIVTDPPYELNFMNKGWDNSGIAFQVDTWKKCYDALKPGGYLLAFGGSRTFHRIACAIEDAGFEIRDTIMWLYGCLSEDTEILTQDGFKQYNKITESDKIRVYDIKSGIYKWEIPQRWNVYKTEQDSCYRIKSDSTDQLVSRNHRCLVEREGELVFEFAENLHSMERVPVLSYDIPYLQEGDRNILFTDLLWQDERLVKELFTQWVGKEESEEGASGKIKFCVERWSNLSEQKRELFKSENKICQVSEQVYVNGEKRRICDGTQIACSTTDQSTSITDRGCASQESQCRGQQIGELDVVCNEQGSQVVREWKTYTTTLATITAETYSGILFCPTVSTGCFVARRNGQVFITGNSGFPKSMNIGLAIDKKNGVESPIVGQNQDILKKQAKDLREGHRVITDSFDLGAPERNNGFKTVSADIRQAQNEWEGWGTTLKPAYEPIIIARKPFQGGCAENVLRYGVGGINIDECRVGIGNGNVKPEYIPNNKNNVYGAGLGGGDWENTNGRFPSNVILTYDETDQDEVIGGFPITQSNGGAMTMPDFKDAGQKNSYNKVGFNDGETADRKSSEYVAPIDSGSAARYFYTAKASKRDRDEGLDAFETKQCTGGGGGIGDYLTDVNSCSGKYGSEKAPHKNTHPTVKPCDLMQYLIRLVTPKGGTILDPFNGSGSTGKAAMYENNDRNANYNYIGIELTPEYLPISEARIRYAIKAKDIIPEKPVSEEKKKILSNQMNLFDIPNS